MHGKTLTVTTFGLVVILIGSLAPVNGLTRETAITPNQLDDGRAAYAIRSKSVGAVTEFEVVVTPIGRQRLSLSRGAVLELRDDARNVVASVPLESKEATAAVSTPDEKLTFSFRVAPALLANSMLTFWQSAYAEQKIDDGRTIVVPLPGSNIGSIKLRDFVKHTEHK